MLDKHGSVSVYALDNLFTFLLKEITKIIQIESVAVPGELQPDNREGAEEAYHVAEQENTDEAVEAELSVVSLESANDTEFRNKVAEEASNLENNVSVEDKLEGSSVDSPCIFCDFRSNWANGVKIHIGRKHVDIMQLDGKDHAQVVADSVRHF